jgi:FixJ family two-component response regulator
VGDTQQICLPFMLVVEVQWFPAKSTWKTKERRERPYFTPNDIVPAIKGVEAAGLKVYGVEIAPTGAINIWTQPRQVVPDKQISTKLDDTTPEASLAFCWSVISALVASQGSSMNKDTRAVFTALVLVIVLFAGASCFHYMRWIHVAHFTVFLIDDDVAILTALSGFLRAAGYATKTYCSGEAFLSDHDASMPGCVILDLSMPGLNGLDVQQSLLGQGVDRPVIFISGKAAIPEIVLAMRAGAIDFLTKPVDEAGLLSAIKSAEERDKTQRTIEARRKIVLQKMAKLTCKEKEVLALMLTGLQNKVIADKLGVQLKTIKVHRGRIHQKMGVKSLAELVRMTLGITIEGPR